MQSHTTLSAESLFVKEAMRVLLNNFSIIFSKEKNCGLSATFSCADILSCWQSALNSMLKFAHVEAFDELLTLAVICVSRPMKDSKLWFEIY